jgi:nucleotide-binding universal stress UspA family protein
MPRTRILAATDLSDSSALALRDADARAGAGSALCVCHVIPSWQRVNALFPQFNLPAIEADEARDARARSVVTAFVREAIGRSEDAYELSVVHGDAAAEIVRVAQAWRADLVVVGSHGPTPLPRTRLGSVAEDVVRHAHCPALVVRPKTGTGCVVGATDFSDSALPALRAAAEEARRVGGHAVFAHSVEWPLVVDSQFVGWTTIDQEFMRNLERTSRQRLEDALAASGVQGECRVAYGEPGRALVREAEAVRADLLVVGTHGRSGISRMVLGSVAEFVVRTAPCSVLVVRLHPSS